MNTLLLTNLPQETNPDKQIFIQYKTDAINLEFGLFTLYEAEGITPYAISIGAESRIPLVTSFNEMKEMTDKVGNSRLYFQDEEIYSSIPPATP